MFSSCYHCFLCLPYPLYKLQYWPLGPGLERPRARNRGSTMKPGEAQGKPRDAQGGPKESPGRAQGKVGPRRFDLATETCRESCCQLETAMQSVDILRYPRETCDKVTTQNPDPGIQVTYASWFLLVYVSIYGGGHKGLRGSRSRENSKAKCVSRSLQLAILSLLLCNRSWSSGGDAIRCCRSF